MWFRPPNRDSFPRFALGGGWLLLIAFALTATLRAQPVTFHLRNGDRVTGTVLSEDTNHVTLSNLWSRELSLPLSEIERRETNATTAGVIAGTTSAPGATNALSSTITTNKPAGGTNALASMLKPVPPTSSSWFKRWKGDVSLGNSLIFGATDQQIYYAKANLTYAQPYQRNPKEFFRNTLSYQADYGKTEGVLSANDMSGSSKTDFDITSRAYLYNLGRAGYDEIRKIDLGYGVGPGLGYHLFQLTNFVMNTELGLDYQVEDRSDGTFTRDFYGRLAEDFTWKVTRQMTLLEKFEYYPRIGSAGQFRFRFESTLSYALSAYLSLNLSVLDTYDTRPPVGVDRNEFQLRSSLGLKF